MRTKETLDWVEAGERLPDPEITVLVYAPAADEPVWLGFRDEDDGGSLWFWADGREVTDTVTHWADVPAGPGGAS